MNGEINIHAKFILKPSFIESKQNMDIPAIVLAFIFGLLIGSFLNVVIYRLPAMLHQESRQAAQEYLGLPVETLPTFNLMTPPSRCGHCGERVKPWQNIPIISWLLLRGQCAGCHAKISIRYPLVELLTGVLFALMAWRYGWTWYTVGACLFTAYVVAMTFIDADTQLLPDELTVPLIRWGLLFNLLTGFVSLQQAVWGALVGYMSLWLMSKTYKLLRGVDGMGGGDFQMLSALGAWLGVSTIPIIVFSAAIVGIIAALIKRVAKQQPMAFGPCLAVAGWVVFLFHDSVMRGMAWYLAKSGF